jgi:NAD(P)-dependent dehydrogenase (short-subunit alcohol dehydrogenase family)
MTGALTAQEAFGDGVAVITGAGSGIGAALAREAGRLGMMVVIADLLRERAENIAAEIQQAKGNALPYVVDVRDFSAVDAMAQWVSNELGAVRLLVNNAGLETVGFTWELTPSQWRGSVDVLVNSLYYGVRAFAPRMIEAGKNGKRAAIASTASIAGLGHAPIQAAYITCKHAAIALSEGLSQEVAIAKVPIDVSVIVPGLISTRIFQDAVVSPGPNAARAERHRKLMLQVMATSGKHPDSVAAQVFEQLAAREFWISTHPEDSASFARRRADYLRLRNRPTLDPRAHELFR